MPDKDVRLRVHNQDRQRIHAAADEEEDEQAEAVPPDGLLGETEADAGDGGDVLHHLGK